MEKVNLITNLEGRIPELKKWIPTNLTLKRGMSIINLLQVKGKNLYV
jgi:hypothetical protein